MSRRFVGIVCVHRTVLVVVMRFVGVVRQCVTSVIEYQRDRLAHGRKAIARDEERNDEGDEPAWHGRESSRTSFWARLTSRKANGSCSYLYIRVMFAT